MYIQKGIPKMKFLSKHEFSVLSESEKSDYYEALIEEKNEAVTVSQFETLMIEFEKLNYKDSLQMAEELAILAENQRKADAVYAKEKRRKGLLISLLVICGFVLVTSAVIIIGMF